MKNQTINILMVDDRKENLLALEAVLTSPEYRLISATSGEEALKWVLKMDFAVILLDVQMPGIDGFETAKLIRSRGKSKDVPIIFLTALSQTKEHVMTGYSVGAIDYIFKPFPPLVLRSKVEGFVNIFLSQQKIKQQNELISEANKKLKRSESLSKAITETSIDSILTVDMDGRILSANPASYKKFGFVGSEFLYQPLSKLLPLFKDRPIHEVEKEVLIESEALRKNIGVFPVEFQLSKAIVANEPIYVCAIRDITEKKYRVDKLEELVKKRNQELYESEEKYRQLVEGSPEAIIIQEFDREEWTFINEKGLKLLGARHKEEVLGNTTFKFIHHEDYELVKSNIEVVKQGSQGETFEARISRLDGELINVEIKCIPFVYMGKPSLHIVLQDITELKQSREFIKQSEKLNVVGELAAGIAHEIRNPLTSLRGFTQLLEFKIDSGNEYVPIMLGEIDRINTIVSELLLLAKPKQVDFDKIDVEQLLQDIIILMNAQANLYGVEIEVEIREGISNQCTIVGLENKLKQVFINIVKNAIEAMVDGGKLRICVQQKGDLISIQFTDNGGGIPREFLEKIGKPFFTTKEKGTGLGIMVCQNIIENHEGSMTIESEVGQGTTVDISLPLCKNKSLLVK